MERRPDIEALRKQYPKGARVELVQMDDKYAPPIGTRGTVWGVDDIGSIMVHWDNGSSLNVVYGEDYCRVVGRICPVCGQEYSEPPALSRKDNKTEICPVCGTRESLVAAGFSEDKIAEVLDCTKSLDIYSI